MLGSGQDFDGGMYVVVANCSEHPVACDMSWKHSMFAFLSKDFVLWPCGIRVLDVCE